MTAILTTVPARILRHEPAYGLSVLAFADGELRVPQIDRPVDSGVLVEIDARDVSIALSRPMDISITNRLPGTITALEPLGLPYVRLTVTLGQTALAALVTTESVARLGLEPDVRVWAMIKTVAIGNSLADSSDLPVLRPWPRG